jgi:hypothetical protein
MMFCHLTRNNPANTTNADRSSDFIDGLFLLQHYSQPLRDFKMEWRDKPDLNVSEYCEIMNVFPYLVFLQLQTLNITSSFIL